LAVFKHEKILITGISPGWNAKDIGEFPVVGRETNPNYSRHSICECHQLAKEQKKQIIQEKQFFFNSTLFFVFLCRMGVLWKEKD